MTKPEELEDLRAPNDPQGFALSVRLKISIRTIYVPIWKERRYPYKSWEKSRIFDLTPIPGENIKLVTFESEFNYLSPDFTPCMPSSVEIFEISFNKSNCYASMPPSHEKIS